MCRNRGTSEDLSCRAHVLSRPGPAIQAICARGLLTLCTSLESLTLIRETLIWLIQPSWNTWSGGQVTSQRKRPQSDKMTDDHYANVSTILFGRRNCPAGCYSFSQGRVGGYRCWERLSWQLCAERFAARAARQLVT